MIDPKGIGRVKYDDDNDDDDYYYVSNKQFAKLLFGGNYTIFI